jgi:hypothetical protein
MDTIIQFWLLLYNRPESQSVRERDGGCYGQVPTFKGLTQLHEEEIPDQKAKIIEHIRSAALKPDRINLNSNTNHDISRVQSETAWRPKISKPRGKRDDKIGAQIFLPNLIPSIS